MIMIIILSFYLKDGNPKTNKSIIVMAEEIIDFFYNGKKKKNYC
jgi:hypothetical protein